MAWYIVTAALFTLIGAAIGYYTGYSDCQNEQ